MEAVDIKTFEPIYDINEMKKYDGFIAPDGGFYKVSKIHKHKPSHIAWADKYVTTKLNYIKLLVNPTNSFLYTISRLKNKQDILIHFYGYIYYGHDAFDRSPIIKYPDQSINGVCATQTQLNSLFNILEENDELQYMTTYSQDKVEEDRHERYVDDLISRSIDRRKKYE